MELNAQRCHTGLESLKKQMNDLNIRIDNEDFELQRIIDDRSQEDQIKEYGWDPAEFQEVLRIKIKFLEEIEGLCLDDRMKQLRIFFQVKGFDEIRVFGEPLTRDNPNFNSLPFLIRKIESRPESLEPAMVPTVGDDLSGNVAALPPSQVGGLPSSSGYAGGAPYHGYGGAPSQVGGFPSGYGDRGPSQGWVTLPSQGAPGGASTPSVSTWMAPSCLETLEFPYIWLMTPFSVLCAFYSDPGSLLEMLGTLTLPDPFDLLWIVVKNVLIRSIKAILMTYLMVLLYNFIQRVKSFFQRKRKSKSLYILFFYGFIE